MVDRLDAPNTNLSQWALDHMANNMRYNDYSEQEIKDTVEAMRIRFNMMGGVTLATKILTELLDEHYSIYVQ